MTKKRKPAKRKRNAQAERIVRALRKESHYQWVGEPRLIWLKEANKVVRRMLGGGA